MGERYREATAVPPAAPGRKTIALSDAPEPYETPPATRAFLADADVWAALAVVLVLAAGNVFRPEASNPVRFVLGLIEGLILPGYLTVNVLFPAEKSLRGAERYGLTLGLNAVIVMLTGLGLSLAAIRLDVRSITLALSILTALLAAAVLWRRWSLPPPEVTRLSFPSGILPWLVFAFAGILGAVTWAVAAQNLSSAQPEFSVTGMQGQLQGYPYEVPLGTRYALRMNLNNPTNHTIRYRMIISDQHDGHIGVQEVALVAKSRWTSKISLPANPPARQERVSFNLYDGGRLVRRLWIRYRIVS